MRHHTGVRRLAAAIAGVLLAGTLGGCGGGDGNSSGGSDANGSSQSENVPTFDYSLSVTFAEPGGQPSQSRLSEISSVLSQQSGRDTQTLSSCPLGDVSDYRTGPVTNLEPTPPSVFDVTLNAFGSLDQTTPGLTCSAGWLNLAVTQGDADASIEKAIAGTTAVLHDAKLSAPQPLYGGEAFVFSYINDTNQSQVTGAGWLHDGYLVTASLFVGTLEPQDVAEWFASSLPVAVG